METTIYDEPEPCPYLPDRLARLPLRRPHEELAPGDLDQRLERGDRRCGAFLYRPCCAGCCACEPLRLDVREFRPNATQRRVWRRGNRLVEAEIGPPAVDDERVELFNRHRQERKLEGPSGAIDAWSYYGFLVQSCCPTVEIRYRLAGRLVGVAVSDLGETAVSAVYCYYDPALARLSLGTFSILKQVEFCREWGKRHLYLGYYIAPSPHMSYKARFLPHERLWGGRWQRFEGGTEPADRPAGEGIHLALPE